MATTIIEFEGLRTSTSFNFKNKKEKAAYWDMLLVESPLRFKNEFNQYLDEKLHVIYSYSQIFKYFAAGCGILTLLSQNPSLFIINLSALVIFLILYGAFHFKFKSFAIAVAITKQINTVEFIEQLREDVVSGKYIFDENETEIK